MNHETSPSPDAPRPDRPLGYWLRVVDGVISAEFASAFEAEQIDRRDWMLLNALAGDVELPGFAAKLARRGKRLRALADRDWIEEQADGRWTLTDEGRDAHARLGAIVTTIRERVAGAVPPEDFATTMTSLEAIARELGWDESDAPRRFGRGRFGRRGFGPGFRPGFGHGFGPGFARHGHRFGHPATADGFGPGEGFGPGFGPRGARCHGEHDGHRGPDGHGHKRRGRHGDRAYERGFEAGFARGSDAQRA